MRRALTASAISPSWLYQQERLAALLRQVQNEIIGFAGSANTTIESMQREAAMLGLNHAADLFAIGSHGTTLSGGFARLSAEAATDLVGFAGDGGPLYELLSKLAPGAADAVKQALFSGIIRGAGAQELAREVHRSLGGNMARSLLIARTETLRAYRESSQRFYESNSDVVHGWKWIAACNSRTCPVCWAMHGSIHPNSEQFSSHPGCRCTTVPVTELSPPLKTGPARFAAIPEKQQLQSARTTQNGRFQSRPHHPAGPGRHEHQPALGHEPARAIAQGCAGRSSRRTAAETTQTYRCKTIQRAA
jgi:SPP1 gp7 family putative phage head morphogenesis protein